MSALSLSHMSPNGRETQWSTRGSIVALSRTNRTARLDIGREASLSHPNEDERMGRGEEIFKECTAVSVVQELLLIRIVAERTKKQKACQLFSTMRRVCHQRALKTCNVRSMFGKKMSEFDCGYQTFLERTVETGTGRS